jgi:serine/threonine-protein kinase
MAVTWIGVNAIEGDIRSEFQRPSDWIPPTIALLVSFVVYGLIRGQLLPLRAIITMGLAYEVIISFCLALSEYLGTFQHVDGRIVNSDLVGFSSVAIWMLCFTVLVPSRPRHALIALVLSASSVPITIGAMIRAGQAPALEPPVFFFTFVLPYAICVVLAYAVARVIYGLGRDIRRAQEMGSYRLLDLIGRGGMGEVWRAEHNMLARPAAIKLIRQDALGADPGTVQTTLARFEREAQVTASLQSPHTVELYDFGVNEDGAFYYVMELLEGIDLESMVQRFGALPAERVVHILRQTSLSLAEAHRHELIHRDIKPANIYLCKRAFQHDFVKVLDFGLVKRGAAADEAALLAVTGTNVITGTPAYIAPEVALGKKPIDGRVDIYALGCVAYFLLTGQRVFDAENNVSMILAHVNTIPDPPSVRSELPIPQKLDVVVLHCLAKEPSDRPATAESLISLLDEIVFDRPWADDRAEAWWRMHCPDSD